MTAEMFAFIYGDHLIRVYHKQNVGYSQYCQFTINYIINRIIQQTCFRSACII